MRALILGTGVVGLFIGAQISDLFDEIIVYDNKGSLGALERELKIFIEYDDHVVEKEIDGTTTNLLDLSGEHVDLILVDKKSADTPQIFQNIIDNDITSDNYLFFQNAFLVEEEVTRIFHGRMIAKRITSEIMLQQKNTNRLKIISEGKILIEGHAHGILKEVIKYLETESIPVQIIEDLTPIVWKIATKRSIIEPLMAIFRIDKSKLGKNRNIRNLIDMLIEEDRRIAIKYGISLRGLEADIYRQLNRYPKELPQLVKDLTLGNSTEIDYLNGALVTLARRKGLNAPLNRAITYIIKGLGSEFLEA